MCIGGGHPKDTNHTPLRTMFKITKATEKSPSILETLKALGITVQDKQSRKYLKEVSQQGLFALKPLEEPKLKTEYDETDCKVEDVRVSYQPGFIDVEESIEGTFLSERFVINQREPFQGHERVIYGTRIRAMGGNDEIISNHSRCQQGDCPWSPIHAWGGDGIDNYVSTQHRGSMFQIMDMEVGETFTTHRNYDQLEHIVDTPPVTAHPNGLRTFHVSSPFSIKRHSMKVEGGSTVIQALDSDENNLYICVPDM